MMLSGIELLLNPGRKQVGVEFKMVNKDVNIKRSVNLTLFYACFALLGACLIREQPSVTAY